MKLSVLRATLDACWNACEGQDVDIDCYCGDDVYDIVSVGQFGVVPDVTLELQRQE